MSPKLWSGLILSLFRKWSWRPICGSHIPKHPRLWSSSHLRHIQTVIPSNPKTWCLWTAMNCPECVAAFSPYLLRCFKTLASCCPSPTRAKESRRSSRMTGWSWAVKTMTSIPMPSFHSHEAVTIMDHDFQKAVTFIPHVAFRFIKCLSCGVLHYCIQDVRKSFKQCGWLCKIVWSSAILSK